jgi:RNA polymerase sigma factor (sigma-70 family)
MVRSGARLPPFSPPVPRPASDAERAGLETELMARFRDGHSPSDFRALYDLAGADLLSWITSQVRSRRLGVDPVDVLQDTFVNVYRYAEGFRDERTASFRVWSRRIATNLVRRALSRPGASRSLQSLPEGAQEPADSRPWPSESASRVEESRSLDMAWMILLCLYAAAEETLADRERAALRMIEIEGCSYSAAAAALGVGASNMKMIVFRARRRIRAEIARRLACRGATAVPISR